MIFDSLEFIKIPESILDAFRYVFASMDDRQFENFLRCNVQLSIGYLPVSYKSSDINEFCMVKIADILGVNFQTSDDLSRLDIEISCSNFERYRFTITLCASCSVSRSMSSTTYGLSQMIYGMSQIMTGEHMNLMTYTAVFRFCNYFLSRGVGNNYHHFESDYSEYALAELSKDIQKYNRDDVVRGLVDHIGVNYFIDLCQKYNQLELLMFILRLTEDDTKDTVKLEL